MSREAGCRVQWPGGSERDAVADHVNLVAVDGRGWLPLVTDADLHVRQGNRSQRGRGVKE